MSHLSTISRLHTAKRTEIEYLLLPDRSVPPPDNIKDLILIARYAEGYVNTLRNIITKAIRSEMEVDHYKLFYLTGSFAVHNFTEIYVDNSAFFFEGFVHNILPNSPPDENQLISLGNKSKIILPKYTFSNITSEIDTSHHRKK